MEEPSRISMGTRFSRGVAAISFALLLSTPSIADTISASASAWNVGLSRSDSNTADSGTVTAKAEVWPGEGLMAIASADSDGMLEVATEPWSWDLFSYGAYAEWTKEYTNESTTDVVYQLDFSGGGEASIRASGQHFGDFHGSLVGSVWADNTLLWQESGNIDGYFDYETQEILYKVDTFAFGHSLNIEVAAGESVVVKYGLGVSMSGCDYGSGSINGWMDHSMSAVPEPSSLLLLGTGLGALGLVAWRKRK